MRIANQIVHFLSPFAPRRQSNASHDPIRLWPYSERFDAAKNKSDTRPLFKHGLDHCIVPARRYVVVVEEMNKRSARERPSEIAHHAGPPPRRIRIPHVADPGIFEPLNDGLRGSVGAAIDHKDFDGNLDLLKHVEGVPLVWKNSWRR
jgi:hypothetical protein